MDLTGDRRRRQPGRRHRCRRRARRRRIRSTTAGCWRQASSPAGTGCGGDRGRPCGGGGGGHRPSAPSAAPLRRTRRHQAAHPTAGKAQWTMLVYMDADTNVEASLLQTMKQAATAGSTDDVNIVALIDRTPEDTGDYNYNDGDLGSIPEFDRRQVDPRREGRLHRTPGARRDRHGRPADAGLVRRHRRQPVPGRAATALVCLDHGGGIFGFGWDDTAPTDPGGEPSHLTIRPRSPPASKAGLAAADVEQFDLLGFHACLMAEYDVAATVAPYADYLLASEEVMWGETWDWAAAMAVPRHQAHGHRRSTRARSSSTPACRPGFPPIVTMSLIDLSEGRRPRAGDQVAVQRARRRHGHRRHRVGPPARAGPRVRPRPRPGPLALAAWSTWATSSGRLTNVPDDVEVGAQRRVHGDRQLRRRRSTPATAAQAATGHGSIYFPADPQRLQHRVRPLPDLGATGARSSTAYYAAGDPPTPTASPAAPRRSSSRRPRTSRSTPTACVASARLVDGTERSVVSAELLAGVRQRRRQRQLPPHRPGHHRRRRSADDRRRMGPRLPRRSATATNTLDTTTFLEPAAGGDPRVDPDALPGGERDQQDQVILAVHARRHRRSSPRSRGTSSSTDTGAVSQLVPDPGSLVAPLVLVSAAGAGRQPSSSCSATGASTPASVPSSPSSGLASGATFHVALAAFDYGRQRRHRHRDRDAPVIAPPPRCGRDPRMLGCASGTEAGPAAAAAPDAGGGRRRRSARRHDRPDGRDADGPRPADTEWTVLIYMDIDNNLEAQKIRLSLGDAAAVGSGRGPQRHRARRPQRRRTRRDSSADDGNLGSIPAFTAPSSCGSTGVASPCCRSSARSTWATRRRSPGSCARGSPSSPPPTMASGSCQPRRRHHRRDVGRLDASRHTGQPSNLRLPEVTRSHRRRPRRHRGHQARPRGLRRLPHGDLRRRPGPRAACPNGWWRARKSPSPTPRTTAQALQSVVGNPTATGEDMGRALVDNSGRPRLDHRHQRR